jgi:Tfp pilus assembly protein FimT
VTMTTARNEAVRRQSRTSVCPSPTPGEALAICNAGALQGYIAFEDKNSNCQRDADEDLVAYVAVHTEVRQGKNITCIGYAPNGFRVPVAGQAANARAVFCDLRGTGLIPGSATLSYGRGLEVVATGRPAVTRLFSDLNTWAGGGTPVTCP